MKAQAGTFMKPGRKIDEGDGKENEQRGPEGTSMKGRKETSMKSAKKIDEGDGKEKSTKTTGRKIDEGTAGLHRDPRAGAIETQEQEP